MAGLNSVRFSCTALSGLNKAGNLPQDADGYRTVVLGGLNVYNSAGELYTDDAAVRELFQGSGLLMKRMGRGRLRGEYGHPKQLPGESDRDFINRIFLINEDRICVHFKEIYLDDKNVKDEKGKPIVAIIGKIAPSGPFGDTLKRSLENKNENVCFSIRAFTDDQRVRGINYRQLKTIITWDYVNDPGISFAEKFHSPALEDMSTKIFSRGELENSLKAMPAGVAQESALMSADELFTSMGWTQLRNERPAFAKW